ncbi:cytochrome P450 [Serendipita vermifera]|nr:cytochrome P450 [Serendipita vermifera]
MFSTATMEKLADRLRDASYVELAGVGVVAASMLYVCKRAFSGPKEKRVYPPGPPKDPLIGNLRQFPKDNWWQVFSGWQKEYGDLIFLDLPGMPFIVVNSLDMAHELMSKRASAIAGRKVGYMAKTLMGWDWSVGFRQADETHQTIRKMLRTGIGPQRVGSHDPLIERTAIKWLLTIQDFKGDPVKEISQSCGEIIISVAYGQRMWQDHGEELLALNKDAMGIFDKTFDRFWFVDIFPWMRFIPSWMPGAEFRRRGIYSTQLATRIRKWPYAESVRLFNEGKLGHSLVNDLLEEYGVSEEAQDGLGLMYFSMTGVIEIFLATMLMFPEVAKKIQDEITEVIGNGRLPSVKDRARLPYAEAVWREVLRWNPAVPIGIPHVNNNDEFIDGYFIPKGTQIQANIGYMLNDPRIWGDPEVFRPERHLVSGHESSSPLPNPCTLIFGFGMRICPGMYLADRVTFHFAIKALSLYNILPLKGKERPHPSSMEYSRGIVRFPQNFECQFVPRNEKAREILSSLSVATD